MLAPVLVTPPSASPLSLDEVKRQINVTHTDDDLLIEAYMAAAAAHLDGPDAALGKALITQEWRVSFEKFSDRLDLPVGPLQGVPEITYFNSSDVQATLPESVYAAFSDRTGPYVVLKHNQIWPQTYSRDDAVTITWTAGYGDALADVPVPIRQAMMMLVGQWYQNREAAVIGETVSELPFAVKALLGPFMRFGL